MGKIKAFAVAAAAICLAVGTTKGFAREGGSLPSIDDDEGSLFERIAADFGLWNGPDAEALEFPTWNDISNPVVLYDQTLKVPKKYNVLSVTLSGTGDSHNGAQMYVRCQIDGGDCTTPSSASFDSGAPAGWTSLLANQGVFKDSAGETVDGSGNGFGGDFHNNNVTSMWCIKVPSSTCSPSFTKPTKTLKSLPPPPSCTTPHEIKIEMATSGCQDGATAGTCFGGATTSLNGLVSIQRLHVFVDAAIVADTKHQCGNLTP